jgi:hypothetical protein
MEVVSHGKFATEGVSYLLIDAFAI